MLRIARDALSAVQWEYLGVDQRPDGAAPASWRRESVASLSAWLRDTCEGLGGGGRPRLLTNQQSLAVWRRVIEDSPEGGQLIESRSAAQWAQSAREALLMAGLGPEANPPWRGSPDFAAFGRWFSTFEQTLAAKGWIDLAGAPAHIAASGFEPPAGRIELLDFDERGSFPPVLSHHLAAAGVPSIATSAPDRTGVAARIELPSETDELALAVEWCAAKTRAGTARIAFVVPSIERNGPAVDAALSAFEPEVTYAFARGPAPGDLPLPGAALSALDLLSPAGRVEALSRWLRHPGFQGTGANAALAARCETRVRGSVFTALAPRAAWRRAGLADLVAREAPEAARRLGRAFSVLDEAGQRQTPTGWARLWHASLAALGWEAMAREPAVEPQYGAWERALDTLARLTPVLGEVSFAEALAELRALMSRRPVNLALPLSGVHVFESIDEVGPGYDAAWIAGVTSNRWPARRRANPLLPPALLEAIGSPAANPSRQLDRCEAATRRIVSSVPEVVFSSASRDLEGPSSPSALLAGVPPIDADALGVSRSAAAARRALEVVSDPAPPLRGAVLQGGTRALDLQSRCPLRAFCEHRLEAPPLEPLARGLSPRLRGTAVHRAAERALSPGIGQIAYRFDRAALRRAATAAVGRVFGRARSLLPGLFELETDRVESVLSGLAECDDARTAFTIAALESALSVRVGNHTLEARLDRLDRLEDGSLAVIDYKTGARRRPLRWGGERLGDVQLPVYAVGQSDPVGAAVICELREDGARYRGIAADKTHFPGATVAVPGPGELEDRLGRWRRQLEALAEEYAAGDTRIFAADTLLAEAAYAPLTRVCELRTPTRETA